MNNRTEITLKFSVDLDMVPGFGHTPDSWVEYLKASLDRNHHYNPVVTILSVDGAEVSSEA